jgi:hypothetical protein
MKRDFDLIRKMLLTIEERPSGWAPSELKIDGYTDEQVGYHAYLLVDGGYAKGEDASSMVSDSPEGMIQCLTWEGHDFIEAARDETRWRKAMGIVTAKGGSVTLDVLKQLLISIMKGTLNLP